MPTTHSEIFDPQRSPDFVSILEKIRRDEPIFYFDREEFSSWIITRYADVTALLRDRRLVVPSVATRLAAFPENQKRQLAPMQEFIRLNLGRTVERRLALRQTTKSFFKPRSAERLRGRIREIIEQLLSVVDPLRPVDIVGSFSFPMPAMVMAELLGVPRSDQPRFIDWSQALISFHRSYDFDSLLEAQTGVVEMLDYCSNHIEQRRRAGAGDHDLADDFARVLDEGRFEIGELAASCCTFLMAGHENTSHLIGNVFNILFTHPDQLGLLKSDWSLLTNAIHEILRFNGVVPFLTREVAESFEFQGRKFEVGQLISLSLFSANRDPDAFANPDTFDIRNPRARHHLGFGHGANQCRGSHLALVETEELLDTLFGRFPEMRPVEGGMETLCQPMLRRYITRYDVLLDPRH